MEVRASTLANAKLKVNLSTKQGLLKIYNI